MEAAPEDLRAVAASTTLALLEVDEDGSGGKAVVTITTPRAFGAGTTFNVSYGSTASTADVDAT